MNVWHGLVVVLIAETLDFGIKRSDTGSMFCVARLRLVSPKVEKQSRENEANPTDTVALDLIDILSGQDRVCTGGGGKDSPELEEIWKEVSHLQKRKRLNLRHRI